MRKERCPIGLMALLAEIGNVVPPPFSATYAGGSVREVKHGERGIERSVPSRGAPTTTEGHLDYALRNEPLDLRAWEAVCRHLGPAPFVRWVESFPNGRHSRRAWYLYEMLTGERLPLPDAGTVSYVALADDSLQLVGPVQRSPRHRVDANLLGTKSFCPLIRRTERLNAWIASDLRDRTLRAVSTVDPRDIERATDYLYHKETKASFQIEREDVSVQRMERFVAALRAATVARWYDESELVQLQNAIVDPRYAEKGYRTNQIYVGQMLPWGGERIHYPCPKPEDVPSLMTGWRELLYRSVKIDPVCQAALLGFGFVFIHPFEDGNGRLHRFVIHATLARRQFTPEGVVIPVSAVMLRKQEQYDRALEAFSKPILPFVPYRLDLEGRMTIESDTAALYRYWDATAQCEYLYDALAEAVDVDLPGELRMLRAYDVGRLALLEIVDMPDRKADLLMRLLLQNGYRLSRKKRDLFSEVSDEEIALIEAAVRDATERGSDVAGQSELPLG